MRDAEATAMTRRSLLARASVAAGGLTFGGLAAVPSTAAAWPSASAYRSDVSASWFELALDLVRATPGFSPPVVSRAFGYTGVTLYEALVHGLEDRRSLAGRLNQLSGFRPPTDGAYHWPTVANSALASILRALLPTAPPDSRMAIDALEHSHAMAARALLPRGIYERSVQRGSQVAQHVFEWSKSDGGHEGFRHNFPSTYAPPTGPGLWEPTSSLPALQPFWGTNRTFLLPSTEACSPTAPPPYSESLTSSFYVEAYECYAATTRLTPEEKAVARFWSDDPGNTSTPPGHSVSILTQLVRALDLPLDRAADAYARVGIAVADAFIACWSTKYHYNLLRPVTYIRRVIDPAWEPLLGTPPFPEYTSGHSVQSAAAAQVLTGLFGSLAFTDRTHELIGLPARSFGSFFAAAQEAAISRLYGGIHFRAAIERGLEQGLCIGRVVSAL